MKIKSIIAAVALASGIAFADTAAVAPAAVSPEANAAAALEVAAKNAPERYSNVIELYGTDMRDALKGAVSKAARTLRDCKIPDDKAVSILFIDGDKDGIIENYIRNAFVEAGKNYVVPNDDENRFLQKIYSEFEYDERKTGMLDPTTIDSAVAEKLRSTQVVVYGVVRQVEESGRLTISEISLDAIDIQTKSYLWSVTFECRLFKGEEPKVFLSDIDESIRSAMQNELVAKVKESVAASPKLGDIKRVALVSLVREGKESPHNAEWERYVNDVVIGAFNSSSITPVKNDASSMADVRRIVVNEPEIADGIMWCALRDIKRDNVRRPGFLKTAYDVVAEIQIQIEAAGSNEVLWADTIMVRVTKENKISFFEWLVNGYPELDNSKVAASLLGRIVVGIVLIVVVIFVLGVIKHCATRVR